VVLDISMADHAPDAHGQVCCGVRLLFGFGFTCIVSRFEGECGSGLDCSGDRDNERRHGLHHHGNLRKKGAELELRVRAAQSQTRRLRR
jgi:hypothetical protein